MEQNIWKCNRLKNNDLNVTKTFGRVTETVRGGREREMDDKNKELRKIFSSRTPRNPWNIRTHNRTVVFFARTLRPGRLAINVRDNNIFVVYDVFASVVKRPRCITSEGGFGIHEAHRRRINGFEFSFCLPSGLFSEYPCDVRVIYIIINQ